MQVIIAQTKAAIVGHSENNEAYFKAIDKLHEVSSVDEANEMLKLTKTLAKNFQIPFFTLAKAELAKKGFEFSAEAKVFVDKNASEDKKPSKATKKDAESKEDKADGKAVDKSNPA